MDAKQAKNADFEKWFNDCYNQHKEKLVQVVLRYLFPSQKDHAESVVQSILMSALPELQRVHQEGTENAEDEDLWRVLFRIALRHCGKHNKRASRGKKAGRIAVQFSHIRQKGDFDPTDDAYDLEKLKRQDLIEDLVFRLEKNGFNEEERRVFRLRIQGHTIPDVAALTGFTEGRVKNRWRSILATCRKEADA